MDNASRVSAAAKVLDTTDTEYAIHVLGGQYVSYGMEFRDGTQSFHATQSTLECGELAVDWIGHGSAVYLTPEAPLGGIYCSLLSLRGCVRFGSEGQSFDVEGPTSLVLDNRRHFDMDWAEGTMTLFFRITASAVRRHVVDVLGEAAGPLTFDLTGPANRRDQARWTAAMAFLVRSMENPPEPEDRRLWLDELERFAVTNMLLTHANSTTRERIADDRAAGLATARAAADYLREHAAEPIRIGALASVLGVSPRALQRALAKEYGVAPRTYLREIRLQLAHLDLTSDPDSAVSRVAHRWGFSSPSRFAREYARFFGTRPSLVNRDGYLAPSSGRGRVRGPSA